MMYRKDADAVVAAWRAVMRDIGAVKPGSLEYLALYREARRLRDEYKALVDAARTNLRPELPPFPG